MNAPLLLAASGLWVVSPVTPDGAVARQQGEVREAVANNPCRTDATVEEIVVCGRLPNPTPTAPVSRYESSPSFAAPERGPWFEWRRGPLSIRCCGTSTTHGTGAGLTLSIRF